MGTKFYEKDGLIINLDNTYRIQCYKNLEGFPPHIDFITVGHETTTVYFENEEECSKAYEFIKDKFKGAR